MFGGSFSILHWIVVLAVVLLLFGGRGKVSAIMGDFGKGLRNFKTGLKGPSEEDTETEEFEGNQKEARPVKKTTVKKAAAKKKSVAKKGSVKKKTSSKKASAKN